MNLLAILPPCTESGNCTPGDFVMLFVNIYKFGLEILAPVAILFFIIGGIVLLTAAGYQERVKRGQQIMSQTAAGVIVVLLSWVIIDSSIFVLTGDDNRTVFGTPWYEGFVYECASDEQVEASSESPESPTEEGVCIIDPPSEDLCNDADALTELCSDHSALADACGVPYPARNTTVLNELIACVRSHIPAGMIDESQIYTYGIQHVSLNYTRGQRVCETCRTGECHSISSCHYGGEAGSEGAMAVDFNARIGIPESTLYDYINAIADPFGGGPCASLVEPGQLIRHSDHTHLSAIGCSG